MIWCGECGYKGKGLYLENEVYCPYCKATGNDIVTLPIDNNTRNLTDEETDIYNSWLEAEAETIDGTSLYRKVAMNKTEELIGIFGTLCDHMVDNGRCDVFCPYAETKDKDDECEAWRTIQKIRQED